MGVVFKAYDPELGRPIALKLLQTDDTGSDQGDRLLREAQALARLQHPNVIAVHDVGTFGTNVFIAMEFVEGENVRRWLKTKPRSQAEILDIYLAAGEGLHAAHRAGLVHRDFKPDNVIVGDDGRVRVLDFGLARAAAQQDEPAQSRPERSRPSPDEDVSETQAARPKSKPGSPTGSKRIARPPPIAEPRSFASESRSFESVSGEHSPRLLSTPLTHAGVIVGTPRFMAPEQHLRATVDAAADQFSFCVSLYWSLYGAFPFAGNNEDEFLRNMLEGRVSEPPSGSKLPRWLREVIIDGLAVNPGQRFASMAELLTALRADPRAARLRWLRAAVGVVAIAGLAGAGIAGALAYKARRGAAEQARVAQQFGQEVEQISAIARYAAFLPLHDTRREMDAIRGRMQRLQERMRGLGAVAAGPGHYALGRGYLALDQHDDALRELETAWTTGYRSAELAYALGLVHGRLYQRALGGLHKSRGEKRDEATRLEMARRHRDPALRYLKEAEGLGVGVDATEYVQGLIALYEQRYEEALVFARKAGERVSWLFEARALEGDIHLMSGQDRYFNGDVDGSIAEYKRAGEAYRAVIEIAHSYPAARKGECREHLERMQIEVDRDQSPEASFKEAIAACSTAALIRPDETDPIVAQASAWHSLATYQKGHGGDARASQEQVVRFGERALAINPRDPQAHHMMGSAENDLAKYELEKGGDPRGALDRAIAHVQRAVEIDPKFLGAHTLLLLVDRTKGDYERTLGLDPRPSYRAALAEGEKARAVAGDDDFTVWNGVGLADLFMGQWELDHGFNPTDALTRSVDAFGKVAHISPNLDYGYVNECEGQRYLAEFKMEHGDDPRPLLDGATANCQRAIERDGNYVGSQWDLGVVYLDVARWELDHARDPTQMMARSKAALDRAHQIDKTDQLTLNSLADWQLVEAQRLAARGRDPQPALAEAEALARRSLALSEGKSMDAARVLARLYRQRAEWGSQHGVNASADVRDGLALVTRLLKKDARVADAAKVQRALQSLGTHTGDAGGSGSEP
jgi:serine/threonine protein kinase